MANLVIDASVVLAWCLPDEQSGYADEIFQLLPASHVLVPRLWLYEVHNSLLVALRRGRIGQADLKSLVSFVSKLDVRFFDPVSCDGIHDLAQLHGLTFYDASYLDLALREGAALGTLDRPLRDAAVRAGVSLAHRGQ